MGDKNGEVASAVPAICLTTSSSTRRRNRTRVPSNCPMNTNSRPSADVAIVPSELRCGTSASATTENRTAIAEDSARGTGMRPTAKPPMATAIMAPVATIAVRRDGFGVTRAAPPLVSRIHRSSSATSCAVSHRSSGDFARHLRTSRSTRRRRQRLQRRQRGRLRVHDVADQARGAVPRERPLARQHLVEDRAQRPEVGPRVGRLPLDLLRRHVLQRADDGPFAREGPASASAPRRGSRPPPARHGPSASPVRSRAASRPPWSASRCRA